MKFKFLSITILAIAVIALSGCSLCDKDSSNNAIGNKDLILATTTSTQDSGLLDVLIPMFEQESGYKVKTIAVGTGQALAMGERGEADVLLVHAPDLEEKYMASGYGIDRQLIMHNDFILVGGEDDVAHAADKPIIDAMDTIANTQSLFFSRNDNSGTNQMEKKLWKAADINPVGESWYKETGTGMGQTLSVTSDKQGYTLSDRATYLAQRERLHLRIIAEGDSQLLNIYHVIIVNPEKFSKVNIAGAKAFSAFLLAPKTQAVIAAFGQDRFGQPLFFADGGKSEIE